MNQIPTNANLSRDAGASDRGEEFVTVIVADQLFGLPIERVHDVFVASTLTDVPLAPREIVGRLGSPERCGSAP